ncbi:MAG: hypothetical protein ABWX60_08745 [Aeromicrobium sp.]
MPETDHRSLIVKGRWWAGLPGVVEGVGIGNLVAFGFMVWFEDFSWFLLFLFGFAIPTATGVAIAAVWAVAAGWVRYEAEGSELRAFRGGRLVAVLDVAAFDRIELQGRLTWANVLSKGSSYFPFAALNGLPRVVAEKKVNRWETDRVELPHVLVWGREAGDAADQRLRDLSGAQRPERRQPPVDAD